MPGASTSCGGGPTPNSIEALRAQLLTAPVARCDEVSFRFLGLSMAGWNGILSLGIAWLWLRACAAER